jgi:hypothetical protein
MHVSVLWPHAESIFMYFNRRQPCIWKIGNCSTKSALPSQKGIYCKLKQTLHWLWKIFFASSLCERIRVQLLIMWMKTNKLCPINFLLTFSLLVIGFLKKFTILTCLGLVMLWIFSVRIKWSVMNVLNRIGTTFAFLVDLDTLGNYVFRAPCLLCLRHSSHLILWKRNIPACRLLAVKSTICSSFSIPVLVRLFSQRSYLLCFVPLGITYSNSVLTSAHLVLL